jgi:hypothetical protein
MLTICTTLLAAIAVTAAPKPKKLLDCNTPIGFDRQIIVEQRGQDLFLRELDPKGEWRERPLSQEEWSSNNLELLADSDGTITTLFLDKGGNWLKAENSATGYREFADADCN